MKKSFLILLALACTLPAMAQEAARFRKIDSLLNYFYAHQKFMGSISIREKDKVVFEKAYGYADFASKTPATPDTKYKIGAVTKMFTAAIIFQLIEEKKLKPDTKLSEFFPKIKNADSITIYSILSHKSGLYNYTADTDFAAYSTKLQTRKEILDRLYSYEPAFKPNAKTEYSDTNYLLLGYIIQDITKKTYKENVAQRIVKKAGLKNTYYFGKINPKKNEAYSYIFSNGQWVKSEEIHESAQGASGGLESTPSDLTKFAQALFSGKIISLKSLDEMTTIDAGIGRGVFNFQFAERKFTGHNGSIEGFSSVVAYYPKDQLSFSLVVNAQNCDFNDLVLGILSCYYKLPYRFPNFTTVTVDEAILKSYEGNYKTPSLPFTLEVKAVDGKLRIHADEQGTFFVSPLSDTEFNYDPAGLIMSFTPNSFTLKQNGTQTVFTKQ